MPDKILLGYLSVLIGASGRLPHPFLTDAILLMVAIAVVIAAYCARRSRLARIIHDFDPIVGVIVCFSLAGPIIAAFNPDRWDNRLAAIDRSWFVAVASSWHGALGRPSWLTDLASILYISFYFVPLAIAIALHRNRPEFESFVEIVVIAFVLIWVGYLAFPATGPRVPPSAADFAVGGSVVSRAVRAFLTFAERNTLDAFPSGHTALSIVYFWAGGRALPRWRVPLGVIALGIVFTTVYLSVHYVADVFAGGALALFVMACVRGLLPSSPRPARLRLRA